MRGKRGMVPGRVEGPVRGWKTFLILDLAIDFCAASEMIFLPSAPKAG